MDTSNFFQGSDFNLDAMYVPQILPETFYLSMDPGQTNQYAQPPSRRSRPRAPLACIPCRSRHLKCDGELVCSRCQLEEKPCTYRKSRRGGKRRLDPQVTETAVPRTTTYSSTGQIEASNGLSNAACSVLASSWTYNAATIYETPIDAQSETETPNMQEKLLDLYYENFHDPHPIALPREQLNARLQADPESMRYLIPVLEYIGSVYGVDGSSKARREIAHHALTDNPLPHNGFSVQALVLFAISVHCCDEYEAGDAILDVAMDIALSVQILHQPFAQANDESDAILAESWRRTAWGLYLTDVFFAVIAHRRTHRLQSVEVDVDLPCEDQEYETGCIPRPRTIADYENREFEEEETIFSSFAYFIDAGRILSSTIAITQQAQDPSDQTLSAADAKIVTWFLYLPKSKQEIMRENGKVDEIMFLAHLWINTEKLVIHRPHSQLQYSSIESASKCTPNVCTRASQKSLIFHTAKASEAIDAAFKLFALPCCYLQHTPMVACSLALLILGQVSACNHVCQKGSSSYMVGRERVRLGLGVLRTHERYWGLARRLVSEVRKVARQLLLASMVAERAEPGRGRESESEFAYSGNADLSPGQEIVNAGDLPDEHYMGFHFGSQGYVSL